MSIMSAPDPNNPKVGDQFTFGRAGADVLRVTAIGERCALYVNEVTGVEHADLLSGLAEAWVPYVEPLIDPNQVWCVSPVSPDLFVPSPWTDDVHPEWPRVRITGYEVVE
jgi:hypothetical protein